MSWLRVSRLQWQVLPAWLLTLVLIGCSSGAPENAQPHSSLLIDGLIIENRATSPISAVRLLVPETGAFVSCGHVSSGGFCSTTFPEVSFSGNAFEITWSQAGQIWSTGPLTLKPDPGVLEAGMAEVRVVILAPGSAGAVLVASASVP